MELEQSLNIQYWVYLFLSGFFFSTGILLILIYFFNKAKISFLYYALTIFIASAIQLLYYLRGVNFFLKPEDFQLFYWPLYEKFHVLLNILVHAGFILFLSASIQSGKGIVKVFLTISGITTVILFSLGSEFSSHPAYTWTQGLTQILYYSATAWLLLKGFLKNIDHFTWIIGGFIIYLLTEIFITADYFSIWQDYSLFRSAIWLSGLTVPFTLYAVFLSKDLAFTSKLLQKELRENAELKFKDLEAQKIREVNNLKAQFFANISHEFRTPLTLILGPIEKKLKEVATTNERVELNLIHRNATRLLNLVNQLLELSKLEAGSLQLRCQPGNISAFISAASSQFQSMAASKNIIFEHSNQNEIVCYFDPDKLEKIIFNLLSNAFKFTPEHGRITLLVSKEFPNYTFPEGFVQLQVTDTGTGIAHEHLQKIFERFYQIDNSITRAFEGSGIGLALTKELAELHHGTIDVASQPGAGTTFTVRLPLGKSTFSDEEIDDTPIPFADTNVLVTGEIEIENYAPDHRSNPTILVLEDNKDLQYFIRENLKQHYQVTLADDGEEGLKIAREEIPDLIITDLMMPKLDGLQVSAALKQDERTSHIPIILLTAKADQKTKLEGLETGVDDYIAKPFDMAELQVRIQNLVDNRKKIQHKFSSRLTLKPSDVNVESIDEKFIQKVIHAIEAHLDDSSFGVDELAHEVAMSTAQLYRKIKGLTDIKPVDLIRNIRLERAASLLKQNAGHIAEIAYQVGFNNLSYFAKCFKEKYGETPSEYLKSKN
jgi:signal transduction histidine kinase/DNA-binding response OmpR family regulator